MSKKCIIVNADDLGLSLGVNQGIAQAYEHGILTSASLMVRWPAATAAAAYARTHPALSVGLHVDLGEWNFFQEEWQLAYQVVPYDDGAAVAQEVSNQLRAFRALVGRDPTHLDSHQHVHRSDPLNSILRSCAHELGVAVRDCNPRVRYCGDFYGQSNKGYPCHDCISAESLIQIFRSVPSGITEIGCHPATQPDMGGMYCDERPLELKALCDPQVRRAAIELEVDFCSFLDLKVMGLSA